MYRRVCKYVHTLCMYVVLYVCTYIRTHELGTQRKILVYRRVCKYIHTYNTYVVLYVCMYICSCELFLKLSGFFSYVTHVTEVAHNWSIEVGHSVFCPSQRSCHTHSSVVSSIFSIIWEVRYVYTYMCVVVI